MNNSAHVSMPTQTSQERWRWPLKGWEMGTVVLGLTKESSLVAQTVKASAYHVGGQGSIPGLGRSPGEGNGTPLQYSCLENPMDGGVWWATVHRVTKSQTRLSDFTFTSSSMSYFSI